MNIKDKKETHKRKTAINKITRGLGKITEDETTIYCHVDEKEFKKKCDCGNMYGFNLKHCPVTIFTHSFSSVYGKQYFLEKNIVYIFDGITFDKPLSFWVSSQSHNYIKFRNCSFTDRVSMNEAENVHFIGCRSTKHYIKLFAGPRVKNLKFSDDYIPVSFGHASSLVNTYIDINCDTLEMDNTEFYGEELNINVTNLIMKDSDIYSFEKIGINADKITLEESEINSVFELKLNTKECNDFSNIKAKYIMYNGLKLSKHNNSYEEIDNLIKSRQLLLDMLATIKLNEDAYQKEEVTRYRKELENSPLTRRLIKKNTKNY